MARADFYSLRVADVETLTDDAAAVRFDVPPHLRGVFAFAPGQSLTLKYGNERRSYSICAPVGQLPRIGVREVAGGAVSGWLIHQVRAGDIVAVQAPAGTFSPSLTASGRHLLIAAGSGITPILSIAASVLDAHADSTVTLIYGNRSTDSVMFADDVADLKDAHTIRMRLVHVLSREPQEAELFSGRLDADRLRRLLPAVVDLTDIDHVWLCGPFAMVTAAIDVLIALDVEPKKIHRELFYVGEDPPVEVSHADVAVLAGAEVTVVLDGRSTTTTVPPNVTVLDGAQKVRPDLPFACKGGVCGTCRALVTVGQVRMRRNFALEKAEVDAGYVLTCQSLPLTDSITVDFDS